MFLGKSHGREIPRFVSEVNLPSPLGGSRCREILKCEISRIPDTTAINAIYGPGRFTDATAALNLSRNACRVSPDLY